jgi:transketolase
MMNKEEIRNGFGKGIVEIAKKDGRIMAITADLGGSLRLDEFKKQFPERFIECGVAEQNMATVASGMANYGKIPFMCSFGVFSPGRNWEQIRTTIAINNLPVKIVSSHNGVVTGPDGVTHQALEDIALMRCLPNMTVIVPCDAEEARKATIASVEVDGPVYIRLSREATPVLTGVNDEFKIGKANILREGKDVSIVGCGWILSEVMRAVTDLSSEGIECEVINMHTISSIDSDTLIKSVNKTGCVVSVEDHQVEGGLGSAIAQTLALLRPAPQEFVAVMHQYGQSGTAGELTKRYGLDAETIKQKVKKAIVRKM